MAVDKQEEIQTDNTPQSNSSKSSAGVLSFKFFVCDLWLTILTLWQKFKLPFQDALKSPKLRQLSRSVSEAQKCINMMVK